jgi:hypothetical protein
VPVAHLQQRAVARCATPTAAASAVLQHVLLRVVCCWQLQYVAALRSANASLLLVVSKDAVSHKSRHHRCAATNCRQLKSMLDLG